jgi:hypothetical protein
MTILASPRGTPDRFRHNVMRSLIARLFISALLLAACGGRGSSSLWLPTPAPAGATGSACGTPPAEPTPFPAFLNYPPSGSANVSTSIGELIEQGAMGPGKGTAIEVTAGAASVPVGMPGIAPTPYPTPFATAPPDYAGSDFPYLAVPLPTLAPSTTYTASDVYTGWSNVPPCTAQYTQFVGTFTTGE